MSLNVGEHFKQRWLATPEAVRQTYCDELKFIATLLDPETQIHKWQHQEALHQQRNRQLIERAYAQLKQQILAEQARIAEERKRQRQAQLEQALAEKRAEQDAQIAAQEAEEQLKQQQQTEYLQQFAQQLEQQLKLENAKNMAKFDVSQAKQFHHTIQYDIDETTCSTQGLDLKTRLELEAEYYIEHNLKQLRAHLQAAAREEIELILAQQLP